VRQHDHHFDLDPPRRRGRRRFDDDLDDDPRPLGRRTRRLPVEPAEEPPDGERLSSWDLAEHGPEPRPDWVITELAAVDEDLGVLKTGKEADVHLVERHVPGSGRRVLLAAKRYRDAQHRMFHRDAGYLEGRRVRRSRETRAMATRTAFGRGLIATQWAGAEFATLGVLWRVGAPVPYPVQLLGTELLLEFIGSPDGTAAPRLAELRPPIAELRELWHQLVDALRELAGLGLTHGDLSAYNVLVHAGRLVLIDLPQVVDVLANPGGPAFLERDVRNIALWFASRGLPAQTADPTVLLELLRAEIERR
jgi:RIO kinase 1